MTAPTWVAAGAVAGNSSGAMASISPALPAGWAQNDIFIVWITDFSNDLVAPSGWTQVTNSPGHETNFAYYSYMMWKRAGSSESAPTFTSASSNIVQAQMYAFRGCTTSGSPIDAAAFTNPGSSSTTMTFPSVTTTQNDAMIFLHTSDSAGTASGWTNATLGTVTERVDTSDAAGDNFSAATGVMTTAGSTGTSTATISSSTWGGPWTIALKSNSLATINGSDAGSGSDTGKVLATIPGTDVGTGADTATSSQIAIVGDAGSGVDTAKILVPGTDSGSGDEALHVVSGGSTLVFASDGGAASDVAPLIKVSDTDTGSAADNQQTAFIGIQGVLPPGPRIVRIAAATNG